METSSSRTKRRRLAQKCGKLATEELSKSVQDIENCDAECRTAQCWQPKNWLQMLENIKQMRQAAEAPVDVAGCCKLAEPCASEKTKRYQTLIALMLSSQTKDGVTAAAMTRLKQHGCTVDNISETSEEDLGKLIYPVGFWKTKAKMIKRTTAILREKYEDDIPDSVEELCLLPGVGPKMAYLAMLTAWNKCVGIGVDTHIHRICNRIGWLPKETKTPENTRKALEAWLPETYWPAINKLLVGFGQTICLPVRPKCQSCLNLDICPYAKKHA